MGNTTPSSNDGRRSHEYGLSLLIVGACTLISVSLRNRLTPTNLVMVYFVGVLIVATRFSRRTAALTSIVSVAAFDFFCVPPYYTFVVADYEYVITFAVMLVVALLISEATARIRLQAEATAEREVRTQALYQLSQELAGHTRVYEIAKKAAELAERSFGAKTTIFLPDSDGQIAFSKRTSDELPVPSGEQGIAQWVFEKGKTAGKGLDTLPGASALYLPVRSTGETLAVMAVVPSPTGPTISAENQHLLEIFASQTAVAIERALEASAARDAEVRAQTESLRTSLLSAVSHDLRTPLSSITGAAATLRSHWDRLDPTTRRELLETVTEEADRLSRLLNNLLEVTRLESGVHLHKEMCPMEEVVGAALHRLKGPLTGRDVRTDIPANLPMVAIDAVLMEQVFVNLIENALKYTPVSSPVEIAAAQKGDGLEVEVRDRGPGIPEGEESRIFEKFFRGRTDNTRGAGLGLAICDAIIEAHGGSIHAVNRPGGGALIRFRIPLTEPGTESDQSNGSRLLA